MLNQILLFFLVELLRFSSFLPNIRHIMRKLCLKRLIFVVELITFNSKVIVSLSGDFRHFLTQLPAHGHLSIHIRMFPETELTIYRRVHRQKIILCPNCKLS